MHILAVVESPSWIEHHIVGGLIDMGHDVRKFAYGASVGEFYGWSRRHERREKNQKLLDLARQMYAEKRLECIFCYVYDDFLTEECAEALAAIGVPIVNLNVDMTNQWYRQIRTARYFTAVLCSQTVHMEDLAQYGAKVLFFPMAARMRDDYSDESANIIPTAPVTFLGTPTAHRLRVLSFLECAGVSLAVYGKYWNEDHHVTPERSIEKTISDIRYYAWPRMKAEGPASLVGAIRARVDGYGAGAAVPILKRAKKEGFLPDEKVFSLFRNSAINIGFTRIVGEDLHGVGQNQIKLRDFEVPLAGGFYLVEAAPDYDAMFVPGREVDTWRTPTELLEKIRYYLTHEEERSAIAAAGALRARTQHTWVHRFNALFTTLGLF